MFAFIWLLVLTDVLAGKILIDPHPTIGLGESSLDVVHLPDKTLYAIPDGTSLALCDGCELVEDVEIEMAQSTPWNLDRVNQRYGLDGSFTRGLERGLGIDVYVLDSGILGSHVSFKGRVEPGFDAFNQGMQLLDCNGHGTHVASTAAGEGLGVATSATIIPVRILECNGRGTLMAMAAGTAFTINRMATSSRKAVVNLSIQSSASSAIDDLVRQLHRAGAVVVVAAANFNSDACNYSPAREPLALTVGASSRDDSKLSSSNFGRCVDLYAPGHEIVGASAFSPTGTSIKSGTSMACPLVAGIVATIWERFPLLSNAQVIAYVLEICVLLRETIYDLDCSGSLAGLRMAQTLHSAPSSTYLARGSLLRGSFPHWHDVTSLRTIQVSSSSEAMIAVATAPLVEGLSTFKDSVCKDFAKTKWVVIDLRRRNFQFEGGIIQPFARGSTLNLVRLIVANQMLILETSTGNVSVTSWPISTLGSISLSSDAGDVTFNIGEHVRLGEDYIDVDSTQTSQFFRWFGGVVEFRATFHPSAILNFASSSFPRPHVKVGKDPASSIRTVASIRRRTLRLSNGRRVLLPGKSWRIRFAYAHDRVELFLVWSSGSSTRVASFPADGPYLSLALSKPGSIALLPVSER